MRLVVGRAVFAAIVLVALGGCETVGFDRSSAPAVRSLTAVAARDCRLIGKVSVNSPTDKEQDQLRDTMDLALQAAATMGGNGLLVDSISTSTKPSMTTGYLYTITGQAFSCPQ